MQITMSALNSEVNIRSLIPRPPCVTGLSRELATVAPSGRVKMNAAQNRVTCETFVR